MKAEILDLIGDASAPLDTPAAARRLGLSESYLHKLRLRGEGPPFVRIGRKCLYRPRDLEAFLEARVVNGGGGL